MSVVVYHCLRTTVITGIRIIKKSHHKLDTENLTDTLIERVQRNFAFVDSTAQRENEGELLSRVFYCDPMASWQKGRLEKNHEFIRYIIPKGTTFAGLDQEQVTLITNHINSVARASLNGCTPFELALLLIDRKLLDLCQLERIPANQVILKPSLLKK